MLSKSCAKTCWGVTRATDPDPLAVHAVCLAACVSVCLFCLCTMLNFKLDSNRVQVGPAAAVSAYIALMEACWAQHPRSRPTFDQVRACLTTRRTATRLSCDHTVCSPGGLLWKASVVCSCIAFKGLLMPRWLGTSLFRFGCLSCSFASPQPRGKTEFDSIIHRTDTHTCVVPCLV